MTSSRFGPAQIERMFLDSLPRRRTLLEYSKKLVLSSRPLDVKTSKVNIDQQNKAFERLYRQNRQRYLAFLENEEIARTRAAVLKMLEYNLDECGEWFGCYDPKFVLLGPHGGQFNLASIDEWPYWSMPGEVLPVPCAACELCAKKKSAEIGCLTELEFLDRGLLWMVTLTVAPANGFINDDVASAMSALRTSFIEWRKHPNVRLILTAQQFGDKHGRRHFHTLTTQSYHELEAMFQPRDKYPDGEQKGEIWFCKEIWQFGHVHIVPVLTGDQSRYVGQYVGQPMALASVPGEKMDQKRKMLADRNEPILKSYMTYPKRPAIGRVQFERMVRAQAPRIMDQRHRVNAKDLAFEQEPYGLLLDGFRPMICRPQERAVARDIIQDMYGEKVTFKMMFPARHELVKEFQSDDIFGEFEVRGSKDRPHETKFQTIQALKKAGQTRYLTTGEEPQVYGTNSARN